MGLSCKLQTASGRGMDFFLHLSWEERSPQALPNLSSVVYIHSFLLISFSHYMQSSTVISPPVKTKTHCMLSPASLSSFDCLIESYIHLFKSTPLPSLWSDLANGVMLVPTTAPTGALYPSTSTLWPSTSTDSHILQCHPELCNTMTMLRKPALQLFLSQWNSSPVLEKHQTGTNRNKTAVNHVSSWDRQGLAVWFTDDNKQCKRNVKVLVSNINS